MEALADRAHGAFGVAEQDFQALDIAGDVPRREFVVRALGHFARSLEKTQRLSCILLHGQHIVWIEGRQVRTGMRLRELRGGAIEAHRAQNVQDLHHHVIIAACFGCADGAIRQRRYRGVVGTGEQNRDAHAQGKRRIGPVSVRFQRGLHAIERFRCDRIAPLEIRELGPPYIDAQRQPAFLGGRRGKLGQVEIP